MAKATKKALAKKASKAKTKPDDFCRVARLFLYFSQGRFFWCCAGFSLPLRECPDIAVKVSFGPAEQDVSFIV